jgi:hypothetical protein
MSASRTSTTAAPSPDAVVTPASCVDPSTLFALPAEALLGISGESHYPDAIRRLGQTGARDPRALATSSATAEDVAQREPGRDLRWFEAQLLPMPDNPYDANAVAVVSPHGQVGYLPRTSAVEYAEVFGRIRQIGYTGAICPAFVDVDKGYVVIVLSWASVCMPEVNAERRKRAWRAWEAGGDLEVTAAQLGFNSLSKLLTGARQHAKERGLAMPPTASELRGRTTG